MISLPSLKMGWSWLNDSSSVVLGSQEAWDRGCRNVLVGSLVVSEFRCPSHPVPVAQSICFLLGLSLCSVF